MEKTSLSELVRAWRKTQPLRRYMDEQNLTVADLASLLGVSSWSISQWSNGAHIAPRYVDRIKVLIPDFPKQYDEWRKHSPIH